MGPDRTEKDIGRREEEGGVDVRNGGGQLGRNTNKIKLDFALANARSLFPKLDSMVNYFDEYGLTFCMITETWIQSSRENTKIIGDLLDGTHIDVIRRDRGRRGGAWPSPMTPERLDSRSIPYLTTSTS